MRRPQRTSNADRPSSDLWIGRIDGIAIGSIAALLFAAAFAEGVYLRLGEYGPELLGVAGTLLAARIALKGVAQQIAVGQRQVAARQHEDEQRRLRKEASLRVLGQIATSSFSRLADARLRFWIGRATGLDTQELPPAEAPQFQIERLAALVEVSSKEVEKFISLLVRDYQVACSRDESTLVDRRVNGRTRMLNERAADWLFFKRCVDGLFDYVREGHEPIEIGTASSLKQPPFAVFDRSACAEVEHALTNMQGRLSDYSDWVSPAETEDTNA